MFHLVAFRESLDPGAAFTQVAAVSDAILATSGDDHRMSEGFNHLFGAGVLINDASLAQARLTTPSTRGRLNVYLEQLVNGLVYGNPAEVNLFPESPIQLEPDEALNLEVNSDPAAAVIHEGHVFLGDGDFRLPAGEIWTVRATTAITLSAGAWVNGALTFAEALPVGRYSLVGARVRGTNLTAARFLFRNQPHRPGMIAINAVGDLSVPLSRRGGLGVWGTFHTTAPPTVDALGVTDTSQIYLLDLMRL